jgi:hypothetical protein
VRQEQLMENREVLARSRKADDLKVINAGGSYVDKEGTS